MRKYPMSRVVGAVYDNAPADNPFLAAMPEMIPSEEFFGALAENPPLPHDLLGMTPEERRQQLPLLSSLFIPMEYMYVIYDLLYRAIRTTYTTRTMLQEVRQINRLFLGQTDGSYATQADSGSILGVPGVGKTSTVKRCLALLPQVIEHTEHQGKPFFCKQVLYLHVECPSDCSVKTLAFNMLSALDRALGSNYLGNLKSIQSASASAAATQIKILCMTYHVGLILIDEIQNAVVTARQNRQVKPLIKFLVELTNDTCTGVYFVGTPLAEELFTCQDHLKRRTRGIRLLPLKPDGAYRAFLKALWPFQFTQTCAPLTDSLANKLYDYSGGIPAYLLKIFQEAQAQALLQGRSSLSEGSIQRAVDILAIKVPKTYSGGTYLSDIGLGEHREPEQVPEQTAEVPRLYANKRGRKAVQREDADLLAAYRAGTDLTAHLETHGLLERFQRFK